MFSICPGDQVGTQLPTMSSPQGLVPDEQTAIKIVEAILTPMYSENQVNDERPVRAQRKGALWTVGGSLKPSHDGE